MHNFQFLPWQTQFAKQWLGKRERFAHAWLIHGMPGIGQIQFARAGAQSLLCEQPQDNLACGQCDACNWVSNGNHPDLRIIRSDAMAVQEGLEIEDDKKQPSKEIKIEQIRSLYPWFNTATHRGGVRVALLYLAEDLNITAANAVLKILEEPPEHTIFLLVANFPDSLLPTLISRCRRVHLAMPSTSEAADWLSNMGIDASQDRLLASGGAPVLAFENQNHAPVPDWLESFLNAAIDNTNPSQLADYLSNNSPVYWIDILQRLWLDIIFLYFGLQSHYFPKLADKTQLLAQRSDPIRLISTEKWLREQKALAKHPLNLKLLAENTANRLLLSVRPAK